MEAIINDGLTVLVGHGSGRFRLTRLLLTRLARFSLNSLELDRQGQGAVHCTLGKEQNCSTVCAVFYDSNICRVPGMGMCMRDHGFQRCSELSWDGGSGDGNCSVIDPDQCCPSWFMVPVGSPGRI